MSAAEKPLRVGGAEGAAMTFEEIACELGITKSCASMRYQSGMRKLRKRGIQLKHLRDLAGELERGRDGRQQEELP
jgi:hypothetical protein